MELKDSEKVSSLISLSNHAYDETKRYRDHIWKILVWTIGLLVGVIAAADSKPDLLTNCNAKWIGSIFVTIIAILGIWDIHFDYAQFVWNRNLLRKCERELKFYKEGIYCDKALLPKEWESNDYKLRQCLKHYIQWIFVILVIAIYCIYVLWAV